MTTLVQVALSVRKGTRALYGYLAAFALMLLVVLGLFREPSKLGKEHAIVLLAYSVVFAMRASSRSRAQSRHQLEAGFDLELALLLLSPVHALIQVFGGLTGTLHPLLYVLLASVSALSMRRTAWLFVLFALGVEATVYFGTEAHRDIQPFAVHAAFILLFGLFNSVLTRSEIYRVRRQSEKLLRQEREKVQADARMFRLVSPTDSATHDDERLQRSSVEIVHQSLLNNLNLLRRTMDLHTCALLLLDDAGKHLRVAELSTDSDDIADAPYAAGSGAVGAAIKRGLPVNLEHLRPGYSGLCYYRGAAVVRAFVGIPVYEQQRLCGVLCADRLDDRGFTAFEEETLSRASVHLMQTLENERVFVQLERAKHESAVLRRASEALGAALSEQDVLDAALAAAADIAPFDFAAVTGYDSAARQHTVRRAVGAGADQMQTLSFRDNNSLTAMVVKNRHYLPYRGDFDASSQTVFTRKASLAGMDSLLILPLVVRDEAIGTFALAARRSDAFSNAVRPALQVLSNQLSVALSNAASVARLSELATTDGLTGCFNKRYFNEEMTHRLQAAERFGRKLSLIITDIDHFKSVNDTYGHATGDVVIRELGSILMRLKRETDIVARFGGEEFCVLCEETDADGAKNLAERVRQEVEATMFETELGKLHVTCSLGVATYPEDANDRAALFEAADRALYDAKHDGRNQVRIAPRKRKSHT